MPEEGVELELQIVNPKEIKDIIGKRRIFLGKVPDQKLYELDRIETEAVELSPKLLRKLIEGKDRFEVEWKFVRSGDRIIVSPSGHLHIDISIVKKLEPEDGGFIKYNRATGKMEIFGKANSLGIEEKNQNRDKTVELVGTIDPSIEVVKKSRTVIDT